MDLSSVAPSLVIGVPSYADRSQLGTAFALASRRLKTSASSPFTIEQLTTALADLEENLKTPRLRLWFRVPANPDVVQMEKAIAVQDLQTAGWDGNPEELASRTLAAAIKSLFAWEWEEAGELSRTCLKLSKKEDLRDEALNVLAATLLAKGETKKALDALRKAVEGEWNLTLQTNLAVVASETDPATAINHMSYLIAGADGAEQRRQAALLAVALWKRSQGEEKASDDEDDFDPPPRSVLDAIYGLLNSSELTEENFYDLGMFLARVDGKNIFGQHNQMADLGLHRNSPSARLVKARAKGLFEHIAEFGPIAQACEDQSRPWITKAIENYAQMLCRMISDDDDIERQKFAVVQSYKLFDTGLPKNTVQRVLLLALLILNFQVILPEDGTPKDVVDEWLTHAFRTVRGLGEHIEMSAEEKETLLGAINAAAYTLIQYRHKEILPTLREADSQSSIILQKTTGFFNSFTVDKAVVRGAARPIFDFCAESKRTYVRLRPMLRDAEAKESVDTMIGVLETISARVSQWV